MVIHFFPRLFDVIEVLFEKGKMIDWHRPDHTEITETAGLADYIQHFSVTHQLTGKLRETTIGAVLSQAQSTASRCWWEFELVCFSVQID